MKNPVLNSLNCCLLSVALPVGLIAIGFFAIVAFIDGTNFNAEPTTLETETWIAEHVSMLDSGQKRIWLYSTVNTDLLLARIAGRPELESLSFEQTDLSDQGLVFLKTFPNLKSIDFNAAPSLRANLLEHLAACPSLTSVSFGNCRSDDLPLIDELKQSMPDCKISFEMWE